MKLVKTTENKNGETLKIYWQETLNYCPALPLFLKVYAELMEKDFTNNVITFNNKNRVVWVENDQGVVGGICYEYLQDSKIGWIVLSFTDPNFRGQGINELCHYIMEEDIKRLGGKKISSLVHVDNISRQKSAKKVGLAPQYFRMNKDLD